MAECLNGNLEILKQLATPTRNRYFYGKLLDAFHLEMEQAYFNRKRWLINRLLQGSGVVCGLNVIATEDGQKVWVQPGVAIDPLGREIIVPAAYCLENPRQPTDACGQPSGEPISEGAVFLCLAYHECAADLMPVLVGDCDTRQNCAPSTVRERYMFLVQPEEPGRLPPEPVCNLADIFLPASGEWKLSRIHPRLADRASQAGSPLEKDIWVVLARINLPAVGQKITQQMIDVSVRPLVYSNELLFELLFCLAERVNECFSQVELKPPVVNAIWPPNAAILSALDNSGGFGSWKEDPRLEITFNRSIALDKLQKPDDWLRVWRVWLAQNETQVHPITLTYDEPTATPIVGRGGMTYVYKLVDERPQSARYLVQMRAENDNIVDTNTPPLLLDPDFNGTQLHERYLKHIWESGEQSYPPEVWNKLAGQPHLVQFGDGTAGGHFHSWFEIKA